MIFFLLVNHRHQESLTGRSVKWLMNHQGLLERFVTRNCQFLPFLIHINLINLNTHILLTASLALMNPTWFLVLILLLKIMVISSMGNLWYRIWFPTTCDGKTDSHENSRKLYYFLQWLSSLSIYISILAKKRGTKPSKFWTITRSVINRCLGVGDSVLLDLYWLFDFVSSTLMMKLLQH